MFEPAKFATREERIAAEVEAIQVEIVRVEQRLRTIGWGTPPPPRPSMADEWAITAGIAEPVDYSDGDTLVHRVLNTKRTALVEELRRLRQQLAGPDDRPRGRW